MRRDDKINESEITVSLFFIDAKIPQGCTSDITAFHEHENTLMVYFLTSVHLTNANPKIYFDATLFDFTTLCELEYISHNHTTFNHLNIASE